MSPPRVSICLPNLNTLPYLAERMATIEAQTFTDWELLVYDGYSTDGAWEYFSGLAANDSRIRIWQGPREGTPGSWTPCIREARGEFVYVATSDDTMAEDFLEKMVRALDENMDCDLAHCSINVIDANGAPGPGWWPVSSLFARSSPDFVNRPHKRLAPFDGILCMLGDNIYTSVTQLLIRRSLFDKIGYYRKDWGAIGDFHWNLRAGLAASTIHVPDTWGGWRVHPTQATASAGVNSPEHQAKIDAMIDDVLGNLGCYVDLANHGAKFKELVERAREVREHLRKHIELKGTAERRMFLMRQALAGNRPAREHLASLVPGGSRWPKGAPVTVNSWFDEAMIVPLA